MAKAKKKTPKTKSDLVALFKASDKRIESLLSKVLDRIGDSDDTPTMAYLRRYQAQIRAILKRLKKDSGEWVDDAIPRVYNEGVAAADDELEAEGIKIEVDFGRLHKQSIKVLSEAVGTRFSDAIDVIGRRADDVFRTVQLDAVAGSVIGYESIQQTTRRLKDELIAKGLTTFKDASGRNWSMQNYADMAARTVTMEAQNRGRWNEFAAHDEDLIVVSSHPMTCPKCEPWQGRVLSITGKTPGYPAVAEAKAAGLWHPRCRHSSALYIPDEGEVATDTLRKEESWRSEREAQKAEWLKAEEERRREKEEAQRWKINKQKQNRHIEGTREHKKYMEDLAPEERVPSVFTISLKELQQIIDNREGIWEKLPSSEISGEKWKIKLTRSIGKWYDINGNGPYESNAIVVILSRTGLHAYPSEPKKRRGEGNATV